MPGSSNFKILIAGGGIAGLTLANMLERFDIDYLLLEGQNEIAPQVGASIGLLPNGLRILDQIGCYEPIRRFMTPKSNLHVNDQNGRSIFHLPDFLKRLEARHGYPLLFFDRQWLLQVLHANLRDKSKVLTGKRIAHVGLTPGCVTVTTTSGERFHGTMVVGADGVHSTVRSEMFRLGRQRRPGYFARDEESRMACHYICCFGIAQNVPGWVDGDICRALGNGVFQLVTSGIDGRVYFFFFSKLPVSKYGKEIPRFTNDMKNEFVKENASYHITEKLTFGQLFAHQITSTLTPLHEYVLEKWFFDRIIVFGDSAHKPNPIGGHGGNAAIESSAEFLNAILSMKSKRSDTLDSLSDNEIHDIFQQFQSNRENRAAMAVQASHNEQRLVAHENLLKSAVVFKVVLPFLPQETALDRLGKPFLGAPKVNQLPDPGRSRKIQFNDEDSNTLSIESNLNLGIHLV
ncbi:hypothetical protein FGRMN_4187 [Fusarium graminum]|nr:hypothetical protein FGRMN_4187 [Fusarium graminum]